MAHPNSRQTLIDYALRALGDDVIEINVSEDQLEDRLDDALEFFQEFHFDGTEKVYLKHQVTGTQITVGDTTSFVVGETVTGQTSGATFAIKSIGSGTLFVTRRVTGTLQVGETLIGSESAASTTVVTVTLGDIENGYLPINDLIIGVANVLPLQQESNSGFNMFDVRYQMMLNDMYALTNTSMIYYVQVQTHLEMINHFLMPKISFQYNRNQDKLFLNVDWEKINIGDYLIVECFRILDPEDYVKVYNDKELKRYFTALVKLQWGNNLKKFEGMQLPGGVTMNGQQIYNEARVEVKEIEQDIIDSHQLPVQFLVG